MGYIFLANGVIIRSDVTEILQSYNRKMPIRANLRQFWGLGPQNCDIIVVKPKVCSLRRDTRVEMLLIKTASGMSSVD